MARRGLKSHKGLAKRFKVTKTGKLLGPKSGYHHKNEKKSAKRVRRARRGMRVQGKPRVRFLKMFSS